MEQEPRLSFKPVPGGGLGHALPPRAEGAQSPGRGQGSSSHLYWTRVLTKLVNVTCPQRVPSISPDHERVTGMPGTVQALCGRPLALPTATASSVVLGQGTTVTARTAHGPSQ